MPENEVTLDEIYAECEKRIKAACDALEAKILAAMAEKYTPKKEGFKLVRSKTS